MEEMKRLQEEERERTKIMHGLVDECEVYEFQHQLLLLEQIFIKRDIIEVGEKMEALEKEVKECLKIDNREAAMKFHTEIFELKDHFYLRREHDLKLKEDATRVESMIREKQTELEQAHILSKQNSIKRKKVLWKIMHESNVCGCDCHKKGADGKCKQESDSDDENCEPKKLARGLQTFFEVLHEIVTRTDDEAETKKVKVEGGEFTIHKLAKKKEKEEEEEEEMEDASVYIKKGDDEEAAKKLLMAKVEQNIDVMFKNIKKETGEPIRMKIGQIITTTDTTGFADFVNGEKVKKEESTPVSEEDTKAEEVN